MSLHDDIMRCLDDAAASRELTALRLAGLFLSETVVGWEDPAQALLGSGRRPDEARDAWNALLQHKARVETRRESAGAASRRAEPPASGNWPDFLD